MVDESIASERRSVQFDFFIISIQKLYFMVTHNIPPDKAFFCQSKSIDIFLVSSQKHMLWYSLEAPRRGASNEYPQHIFSWRNNKNIYLIPTLI